MTGEEAIGILEDGAWWDVVDPLLPCDSAASAVLHDAVDMAIAALRAQQEPVKLDMSRWEKCDGCELCKNDYTVYHIFPHYKFCPVCGRPLTEEARAELERRMNGETTDS